jgi:hypothetical protein
MDAGDQDMRLWKLPEIEAPSNFSAAQPPKNR